MDKDLASAIAQANQVIASQREEITALSIRAHKDAMSIITKKIPVPLSSPKKKQKLAAEKERTIKIKQEQSLQIEAAMEAKKKALQDEKEKKRLELESKQKEEEEAKERKRKEIERKAEEEQRAQLQKEKEMQTLEREEKEKEEEMANIELGPLIEEITSSILIPEIEEVFPDQLEVEADPLEVPTVLPVEETKEETTTPIISTVSLSLLSN